MNRMKISLQSFIEVVWVAQKRFFPRSEKQMNTTIRVERDKLQMIDDYAALKNISRSAFINQCIDYALKNMDMKSLKKEM